MCGFEKVLDHNIVTINQNASTIIVRKGKSLHTIDLKICADNFKNEHGTSNGNCVGDRNIEGKSFCFYTSDVKTMVFFKKPFVCNLFGNKFLVGNRTQRFHQLQKSIKQLRYTTYDLT